MRMGFPPHVWTHPLKRELCLEPQQPIHMCLDSISGGHSSHKITCAPSAKETFQTQYAPRCATIKCIRLHSANKGHKVTGFGRKPEGLFECKKALNWREVPSLGVV